MNCMEVTGLGRVQTAKRGSVSLPSSVRQTQLTVRIPVL